MHMCTSTHTHTQYLSLWGTENSTFTSTQVQIFYLKWLLPVPHACQHSHTILEGLYFYPFQYTFMVLTFIFCTHPHILSNPLQMNFIDTNICSKGIWNYKHPHSRRLHFKHEYFAMEILAFFIQGIKSASCVTASNQTAQLQLQLCSIIPGDRGIVTIINSNAFR